MAEGTDFKAALVHSFFTGLLVHPISGHWVWGGGWLAKLGFTDTYNVLTGSGILLARTTNARVFCRTAQGLENIGSKPMVELHNQRLQ